MKALTIWQPWATLIMIGAKPIEWRHWRAPSSLHGQRIAIHAGARKVHLEEVYQLATDCLDEANAIRDGRPVTRPTGMNVLLALPLLNRLLSGEIDLPLRAILGTAVLGEPKLASDLGFPVDSDRLHEQNWGWPLTAIERFPDPIHARGAQGFWNWNPHELEAA